MGAINYGTNKDGIINLGARYEGYEDDDFVIDDTWEEMKYILNKYDFKYYDIELTSGYYQGWYLSIGREFIYLYDEEERQEMRAELHDMKKMLLDILDNVCIAECFTSSGWCGVGWCDDSRQAVEEFITSEDHVINSYPLDSDFATWEELQEHINTCTL